MIQDILPHIFYNSYQLIQPTANDFIFLFKGREVVITEEENNIRLPRLKELAEQEKNLRRLSIIFQLIRYSISGLGTGKISLPASGLPMSIYSGKHCLNIQPLPEQPPSDWHRGTTITAFVAVADSLCNIVLQSGCCNVRHAQTANTPKYHRP